MVLQKEGEADTEPREDNLMAWDCAGTGEGAENTDTVFGTLSFFNNIASPCI